MRSFVVLILLFSGLANAELLNREDYKSLSYNKLLKLRKSYIEFVKQVEKDHPAKVSKAFFDFDLIQNAYAGNPELCFFGGWPSKFEGRYCRSPWKKKDDAMVKDYGGYTPESACGASDEFRCNPVLFGSPVTGRSGMQEVRGVNVNFSPNKNGNTPGYCVKTGGSYVELTQKCEKASRESIDDLVALYKEDPTQIDKFTQAIKTFCESKPGYDACDDLAKRIKDITGKDIGNFGRRPNNGGSGNDGTGTTGGDNGGNGDDGTTGGTTGGTTVTDQPKGYGNFVLNKCKELIDEEDLVEGTNLFAALNTDRYDCVPDNLSSLESLDDIKMISEEVMKEDLLIEANKIKLQNTLNAFFANKIKFDKDSLDTSIFKDKATFRAYIQGKFLGEEGESYRDAIDKVYDNLDKSIKSGALIPLEKESVKEQFNHFAQEVNKVCKEIYDKFDGDRSYLNRNWGWYRSTFASGDEEAFYQENKPLIEAKVKELFDGTEIAHLLGTDKFKDKVMDPTESFVEECAVNEDYKVVQAPVSQSTIDSAHKEVDDKLKENLDQIKEYANIAYQSEGDVDDALEELIQQDPYSAIAAAQLATPDKQAKLAGVLCSEVVDIYSSNRTWKYWNWGLAGVGTVAGGVLIASGLGAPVGAALVAGSTALVTTAAVGEGYMAYENYMNAKMRERGVDNTVLERRQRTELYLEQHRQIYGDKVDAGIQGGLAALGVIPGVKAITTSGRVASTSTRTTAVVVANADEVGELAVRGANTTGNGARTGATVSNTLRIGAGAADDIVTNIDDVAEVMGDVAAYTSRNVSSLKQAKDLAKLPSEVLVDTFGKSKAASLFARRGSQFTKLDAEKYFKNLAESLGDATLTPRQCMRRIQLKLHPDQLGGLSDDLVKIGGKESSVISELYNLL